MLAKMVLIGNLTADPVVKQVQVRGEMREVVEFSIAVNNPFNKEAPASFFNNIAAWNGLGQTVKKFATKGSPLYVEADAETRSDEKDGVKRNHLNLTVTAVRLLGSRRDASTEERYQNAPPSETEQSAAPAEGTMELKPVTPEAVAEGEAVAAAIAEGEITAAEAEVVEEDAQEKIPVPF